MRLKRKILYCSTIVSFTALIGGFSVCNVLAPKETVSWNENRTLAPFPDLSPFHILGGKFDDDFEAWFSDHFFARDFWIELKSRMRRATLFIENNDIYYAKNDRLVPRFGGYSEEALQSNIEMVQSFSEDNSLKANILLVPTAASGASSELPFGTSDVDQTALLDEIEGRMQGQNFIRFSTLPDASCYFRTDHHWNHNGAYLGYEAICRSVLHKDPKKFTYEPVSDAFSGTMYSKSGAFWTKPDTICSIIPEETFTATVTLDSNETLDGLYSEKRLQEKDKYTYYIDGNHAITEIHTSIANGKSALIIKDSYSHILMPFLASEYEDLILIDLRYYHQPVSGLLKDNTDLYFIYSLDNFAEDPNLAFLR